MNPLAEDENGALLAADAKLGFDDNAAFRQKELFAMRDDSQIDPREVCTRSGWLCVCQMPTTIRCFFQQTFHLFAVQGDSQIHLQELCEIAHSDSYIDSGCLSSEHACMNMHDSRVRIVPQAHQRCGSAN